MLGFSKIKVLFLDEKWNQLGEFKVKSIPRMDELVFFHSTKKYHQVIAVIHCFNSGHGIVVVLKEYLDFSSVFPPIETS